ncbi:MAG: InlB B-repeat-containing protein, partial [Eubacteriales bacterium]
TVSFDSNTGTPVSPILQNYNTSVTKPTDPTKTGNTFVAWYSDSGLTTVVTWPYTLGAADVTFYAKWSIASYTITFDANGGTGGTTPSVAYGTIPTPPTVTKTGYSFVSWDPAIIAVTGEKTYTAQWSLDEVLITFDANGGTGGTGPTSMLPGATLTAPTVTKEGYVFQGWDTTVPATVPSVSTTYTAQWVKTAFSVTKTGTLENPTFTVNIQGWVADNSYQIWTYQRVQSDIFLNDGAKQANQWILAQAYTLGSEGVAGPGGSINFTVADFTSPDNNYTVAVRIMGADGKYVGELIDSYTSNDVLQAVITKVHVDGNFSTGSEIKEIKTGSEVLIKVFGNLLGMTYTATVKETLASIAVSNTNEFVWDISGLEPRIYTIILTAANESTSATREITFNLYKTSGVTYAEISEMPAVPAPLLTLPRTVTITPTFTTGNFAYQISEPNRQAFFTSEQTTSNDPILHSMDKYGTYFVVGYASRTNISSYDDGVINTVNINRSETPATVTLTANKSVNPVVKGTEVTFTANATIPEIGSNAIEYSFWRYDAVGYSLVKDWSTDNTLIWNAARVGSYSIQVRTKGADAGSYEAVKSISVQVTGEDIATGVIITLNDTYLNEHATAKVPIVLDANATSSTGEDLLYKFYVYDDAMQTKELQQYSADSHCTWIPRKAGTYRISVLVKNQVSFGVYDAVQSFTVVVK